VTNALLLVEDWPATAAASWVRGSQQESIDAHSIGPADRPFEWASVTKVLTALAVWIAVEEGAVAWSDAAGPPGATLAHLLSHASGIAPDANEVVAPPGSRRIYSNAGFEVAAEHVARATGVRFEEYVREAVLEPLSMTSTRLSGSPAHGASGCLVDLMRLGGELHSPSLVAAETVQRGTDVAFPGISGVLPGFGRMDPNDWGLGVEVRSTKHPHWTGRSNSPRTFGHFGRSGSFIWVDPVAGVVLGSLADRPFGPWAARSWPALSDAVLTEAGGD
jgi:CubicO group peptidase (beta-lactamase class C family)